MANLKEIRSRIVSVNSTKQITSAMKMVSAAKLHRAQAAIARMRPYAEKMQDILRNLSDSLDVSDNVYGAERDAERVLIMAINSNRGLCGGFNNNVNRKVRELIAQHDGAKVQVLGIGKKAYDAFNKTGHLATGAGYPEIPYEIFNDLNFVAASEMAQSVMDKFAEKKLDKVYLVYNSFKNAAVQNTTVENFLPIEPPKVEEGAADAHQTEFIFEPNEEEIVQALVPKTLKIQFYKALLDSNAAEHGARMTSMHQATDNATELVKELNLVYNKARQASITNEILEIVSGAEALKG
ncbi:MAG: ATP synthase F1 subunit gamma [Cryomorphaceae bacterium]